MKLKITYMICTSLLYIAMKTHTHGNIVKKTTYRINLWKKKAMIANGGELYENCICIEYIQRYAV